MTFLADTKNVCTCCTPGIFSTLLFISLSSLIITIILVVNQAVCMDLQKIYPLNRLMTTDLHYLVESSLL